MKIPILFFCSTILLTAQAQLETNSISMNQVFLCGAQDVYDKTTGSDEYKLSYEWPEGTYTMFEIEEKKNKISYYNVLPAVVNAAKSQYSQEGDIVRYVMNNTSKDIVFVYDILEKMEGVGVMYDNSVIGDIYILKLPSQSAEESNTTIQLRKGVIRYSSVGSTGTPYHSDYPILAREVFVSLLNK